MGTILASMSLRQSLRQNLCQSHRNLHPGNAAGLPRIEMGRRPHREASNARRHRGHLRKRLLQMMITPPAFRVAQIDRLGGKAHEL